MNGPIATLLLALLAATSLAQRPAYVPAEKTPTAERLSRPGALADYVNAKVAAGEVAQLPGGRIVGNVVLDKAHGATIQGVGDSYQGDRKDGWRSPSMKQGNTLLVPADPAEPVIRVVGSTKVKIRDLTIDTPGVGVSLDGVKGRLTLHPHLSSVAIHHAKVGVRMTDPDRPGADAAADVVLHACLLADCERGVELNHPQAVNLRCDGQTYFYHCDYAVWINNGGHVVLDGVCGNGVGTWLRILKAGGNLVPCVLRDVYSDRSLGGRPAAIADARGCADRVTVLVDGKYSMSYTGRDYTKRPDGSWEWREHDLFFAPDGSDYAAENSVFKIAHPEAFTAFGNRVPVDSREGQP